MTGISKHLIVFLYMVTFFSGVSCFTLVLLMKDKERKIFGNRYAILRNFIASLFFFLVINFLMFYREYFFLNREMNIGILFLFDVCLVSLSYFWLEFNNIKELNKWMPFIRVVGCTYVFVWLMVYIGLNFYKENFTLLRSSLSLSADAAFCFLIIGCAIYSAYHQIHNNIDVREKKYFATLSISFSVYLFYMYFVDLITILVPLHDIKLKIVDFYYLDPVIFLFLIVNIYTLIFIQQKIRENSIADADILNAKTGCCLEEIKEFYHLTQRETEMMELVLQGMSNPQISKHLNISNYTVKRHMNNIFKKTNVKSRFELVRICEKEFNGIHPFDPAILP